MEAANRGAMENSGYSVGLNIQLPFEQKANPYVHKWITFEHFFVRKVLLLKYSYSFIILPGGFGTILVAHKAMESGDIDRVIKLQDAKGLRFGEAAVRLGLITVSDLRRALAQQYDLPHLLPETEAIPVALTVNELLTNALRHAFPAKSWIRISLASPEAETIELVIADNGRALPSGFDPDADAGMLLVEALAAQLNATLIVESNGNGTTVKMVVPL